MQTWRLWYYRHATGWLPLATTSLSLKATAKCHRVIWLPPVAVFWRYSYLQWQSSEYIVTSSGSLLGTWPTYVLNSLRKEFANERRRLNRWDSSKSWTSVFPTVSLTFVASISANFFWQELVMMTFLPVCVWEETSLRRIEEEQQRCYLEVVCQSCEVRIRD